MTSRILCVFISFLATSQILLAAPNLRGSLIDGSQDITISTPHEIVYPITSRNLRGTPTKEEYSQVENPPSQGILYWVKTTVEYPILKALNYLFPVCHTYPSQDFYYNDDTYIFDEYFFDELEMIKARQRENAKDDIKSTDDDNYRDNDDYIDGKTDDDENYLANDDDHDPLYFLDHYYYDYIRFQEDDFYSSTELKEINTVTKSIDNNNQSSNNHITSNKPVGFIVPTPVAIRNLNLRGSAAPPDREKQHSKTSVGCNCIIPEEECNPDHLTCPLNYDPVCGCDNKTYSNSCAARYFGCNRSWKPGRCHGHLRATGQ